MPVITANLTMMYKEYDFLDRFEAAAKDGFQLVEYLFPYDYEPEIIAQKLQAAGYKVKTTQTSKGVRIVVGPEKGKVAALALKDKLNNDSRVDVNSGWVLYW